MNTNQPTAYPEVNALVQQVLEGAQEILGSNFVGMYLDGSLANGGFDQDSDIDFVIVTEEEVHGEQFEALKAMHARLSALDSPWAIQLEGSYISLPALRRHDPALTQHPNLERGAGEVLKIANHGEDWDVHRYVLRERGIILTGPDPRQIIERVSPGQLKRSVVSDLPEWLRGFLEAPDRMTHAGYQSYVVLTICRMLYTHQTGRVLSKRTAAEWAQDTLDPRWTPLIQRAWIDRHGPARPADPEAVAETLEMIRYTLDLLQR